MENSKKLTIEELRKAQDLQAELFGLLSKRIGERSHWSVCLYLNEFGKTWAEEYAVIYVNIENEFTEGGFVESAALTDWAHECQSLPNLRKRLNEYLDKQF